MSFGYISVTLSLVEWVVGFVLELSNYLLPWWQRSTYNNDDSLSVLCTKCVYHLASIVLCVSCVECLSCNLLLEYTGPWHIHINFLYIHYTTLHYTTNSLHSLSGRIATLDKTLLSLNFTRTRFLSRWDIEFMSRLKYP